MIETREQVQIRELQERLKRIEEEMLDSCVWCRRYRELADERQVVISALKQLGVGAGGEGPGAG